MEKDNATLSRQGMSLFNFWASKKQNDKKIGDLTVQDFIEMCAFLAELGDENEAN
jgi:hypothetical protein